MQRRGTVHDIAKALVYLLSDMSPYVTGHTLAVDGGFTSVGPVDYSGFASARGHMGAKKA